MIAELEPWAVVSLLVGLGWLLGLITGVAAGRQRQLILVDRLRAALGKAHQRLIEREYQLTMLLEPAELPCGRCQGEGEAYGCPGCGQEARSAQR